MDDSLTAVQQAAKRRARTREADDRAREALHRAILDAFADGKGPSEIARAADITREYAAKIRDQAAAK